MNKIIFTKKDFLSELARYIIRQANNTIPDNLTEIIKAADLHFDTFQPGAPSLEITNYKTFDLTERELFYYAIALCEECKEVAALNDRREDLGNDFIDLYALARNISNALLLDFCETLQTTPAEFRKV